MLLSEPLRNPQGWGNLLLAGRKVGAPAPKDLSLSNNFRSLLTPAQRAVAVRHTIDPGFVHHGGVQPVLGKPGMDYIDAAIRGRPALPDWQKEVRIDHIYTAALLEACSVWGVKSLGEVAAARKGKLVCSTEQLAPAPEIYDDARVVSTWAPPYSIDKPFQFHYSSKRVRSDTLRSNLAKGNRIALIAEFHIETSDAIIFHPLVMGFPWLEASAETDFEPMWLACDFYEHYIEDFDEFSKVKEAEEPADVGPMSAVSEYAFKLCLSKILGDSPPPDWGGEQSDFF